MTLVARPDGAILHSDISGNGPPLLLITGLSGRAAFWDAALPLLAGRTLIRFDQRGIGRSSRGTARMDVACIAEDALAVLDAHGIATADVLGHSMGGVTAQTIAAVAPQRVRKLILSGTWHRSDTYMRVQFAMRRRVLASDPVAYVQIGALLGFSPDWVAAHPPAPDAGEADATVIGERIDALMAFDGAALPPPAAPVLIIGTGDYRVVPPNLQQALHAALPGSSLRMLDGGGHFYPATRAAEFADVVNEFLGAVA